MTELSRWSFDKYVRRPGGKRFEFPMLPHFGLSWLDKNVASVDPYWIVEGSFGDDENGSGSCSYGHCQSLEEAQAQLALLKTGAQDERDKRYTDWVITECTPMLHVRVVHREPRRELTSEES